MMHNKARMVRKPLERWSSALSMLWINPSWNSSKLARFAVTSVLGGVMQDRVTSDRISTSWLTDRSETARDRISQLVEDRRGRPQCSRVIDYVDDNGRDLVGEFHNAVSCISCNPRELVQQRSGQVLSDYQKPVLPRECW
jgi:hypothetical protein